MTIVELGDELGIGADDVAVMVAALGDTVGDELTWKQAADLLDVLDARFRVRYG